MTGEHLEAILKAAHCTKDGGKDKDGWASLPEGSTMTLYVAHEGASLSIARVESVRTEGELLYARTPKKELFALVRADVYAIGFEGSVPGQPARRAGFG